MHVRRKTARVQRSSGIRISKVPTMTATILPSWEDCTFGTRTRKWVTWDLPWNVCFSAHIFTTNLFLKICFFAAELASLHNRQVDAEICPFINKNKKSGKWKLTWLGFVPINITYRTVETGDVLLTVAPSLARLRWGKLYTLSVLPLTDKRTVSWVPTDMWHAGLRVFLGQIHILKRTTCTCVLWFFTENFNNGPFESATVPCDIGDSLFLLGSYWTSR